MYHSSHKKRVLLPECNTQVSSTQFPFEGNNDFTSTYQSGKKSILPAKT